MDDSSASATAQPESGTQSLAAERPVRLCVAYPLAVQSQGDEGNAAVLAHRVRARGGSALISTHHGPGPLPDADVFLVGGLDESGLPALAGHLRAGGLAQRVAQGAGLLAVNAGFQAVSTSFEDGSGTTRRGLGLLDVTFRRGPLREGPAVLDPELDIQAVSGYESHHAISELGAAQSPLGRHRRLGAGRQGCPTDGAVRGAVIGTMLHGPILARNPELADLLLSRALGSNLSALPGGWCEEVRRERISEDMADPTGWAGTRYGRDLPRWRTIRESILGARR